MITNSATDALRETRARTHIHCGVCGVGNDRALRLEFHTSEDASVQASFDHNKAYDGYAKLLPGGVVSAVLDGAMRNCLFAREHPGVTAETTVRFRHRVCTGVPATVRGWIERSLPALHVLRAEIVQGTHVKATASGKFMERDHLACAGVLQ